MDQQTPPLLEIKNLSITFTQYQSSLSKDKLPVLTDLHVTVKEKELVAVVGSSGSGKSLLAHAVLGILPYNAVTGGQIYYRGQILTEEKKKNLRGNEIVLVPQSVSYLDPLMKVGPQIRKGRNTTSLKNKTCQLLLRYGLAKETEDAYPFELSGGMARRVLISTAVMEQPKLVIADEPTPGLPVETAKRVLGHLRELADDGAGVLLITHDLELALEVADKIAVFYAGTTVEEAYTSDFILEETLRHPYTKALYRAMPQHGFQAIGGNQPYVKDMPPGCPFAPRCQWVQEDCNGDDVSGCGEHSLKGISYQSFRGGRVRCLHPPQCGGTE